MAAFNVVRMRVKPGMEQAFIDAHRAMRPDLKGFVDGWIVKTGERSYCIMAQWRDFQSIVDARPKMIGMLDSFRHMLEDLGGDLGLTDPISGESVLQLQLSRPKPKARAKSKAKPAKGKSKPKAKAKPKTRSRAKKRR
ncbi:MAG TPA: hypothetical protein VMI92_00650 [Steroidobacteraceae bacterium]|nr:hypothetical protein [Steroidobacteraceae bacterium]